jgi:hypothetical protein
MDPGAVVSLPVPFQVHGRDPEFRSLGTIISVERVECPARSSFAFKVCVSDTLNRREPMGLNDRLMECVHLLSKSNLKNS